MPRFLLLAALFLTAAATAASPATPLPEQVADVAARGALKAAQQALARPGTPPKGPVAKATVPARK